MFGEEEIIGEQTIKVPKNRRITLPSFSHIDKEQIIVPHFSEVGNVLFIYSEEEYNIHDDNFKDFLEKQRSIGKISRDEFEKYQRLYNGPLSFLERKVDQAKRFQLEKRMIDKLEITDTLFIIGRSKQLVLCKDKETYLKFDEKSKKVPFK